MKTEKVIVDFGRPEDGWLLINIKIDDFALEIDSSDVPNPIQQFCSVIKFSVNNLESEVLFHLEPNFNIFRFSPINGLINFQVLFFENDQETLLKEISGNFEEIMLPFFRAIKNFLTSGYDENHWEIIEDYQIEEVTNLIKIYKNSL